MKFKFAQSFVAATVAVSALLVSAQAHADSDTLLSSGTFAGTSSLIQFDLPTDSSAIISLMTADPVLTGISFKDLTLPGTPAVGIDNITFLNSYGGNPATSADVITVSINKLLAGHQYEMSWTATAGNDYEAHASFAAPISTAVPEPESLSLVLGGLGVAGFALRRRQRAQA